jgi:hypothetical protein
MNSEQINKWFEQAIRWSLSRDKKQKAIAYKVKYWKPIDLEKLLNS